jgi:hypothetical protein
MLDFDLAELYGVPTKSLNLAVKRNIKRFPPDFMFQITKDEWHGLRFQFEISKGRGGTRYMPYAFTEQGLAMLSGVLNSDKAIDVNISIMRAFVLLRQHLSNYKNLKDQIEKLENEMNKKFKDFNEALNYLLEKDIQQNRKRIGFNRKDDN